MGLQRLPWRTSRVPVEINEAVPILIVTVQEGDQEAIRKQMLDPIFLSRKNVGHTLGTLVALASFSCPYALRLAKISDQDRNDFFPRVVDVAADLPVQPARERLFSWLKHVTLGGPAIWYSRPSEFNLEDMCCTVAIVAACARSASWSSADVQQIYDLARDHLEHNSRILKS